MIWDSDAANLQDIVDSWYDLSMKSENLKQQFKSCAAKLVAR